MGVAKNFVVKNGIEVSTDLLYSDVPSNNVGIGTTIPTRKLDVNGNFNVVDDARIGGIGTVEGKFGVGVNNSALYVDTGTERVGINTTVPDYNLEIIGDVGVSSHLSVGGITTTPILHVTGLTSSVYMNVTGVTTVGGAVTMSSTGIDVNNIDVETLTGRGINITGGITASGVIGANNYTGDGSSLSGIVTTLVAGENINISGGTGTVTITGLAKTDNINADTLVVTGISTLGILTGATSIGVDKVYALQYFGDGSQLTGIDTSGNFQGKTIVCENVLASNPGVGTFGSVVINNPTGRITATEFYGNGANLTNTGASLGSIDATQRLVTTGIATGSRMVSSGTTSTLTYNPTTDTLSCTNFSGNGANLTNTGSTLSATSGTERVVFTNLTSGTMTASSTDADVAFNASTSELLLGTDKITLNASTGAATFAGNVIMSNPGVAQIDLFNNGSIRSYRGTSTATDSLLQLRSNIGGSAATKAQVFADGSATFASNVEIGSYDDSGDSTSEGVRITPTGFIGISATDNSSTSPHFRIKNSVGTNTVEFFSNGSATLTGTVTASSFSGSFSGSGASLTSIPNGALDNSTISGISLGSNLATLTRGSYLTGSNYNGSTARTWAVDATTTNSGGKVVARDGSGNFSAGTVTATLSGTATNATNCRVDVDNSTNSSHYVVFTGGDSGNQRLNSDTALRWNPSSNTLFATTFSGNATTASNATNAGTLDGIDSGSFLRSDTADTCTADIFFSGGGGAITVNGGSDIRFSNGNWTGDTSGGKIQLHSNILYISGGSSGFIFRENGTDRIRIDGSGNLHPSSNNTYTLGTSSYYWSNGYFTNVEISSTLNVRGAIDLADNDILRLGSGDDAELFCNGSHLYLDLNSGIGNFYIRDGTTTRFTFDDAGHFTATGDISSSSDVRLKDNIETLEGSLDKIKQLRGVEYDRIDFRMNGEKRYHQLGVIAQEIEKIYPDMVDEDVDGMKTVSYQQLIPVLIEAVKELSTEVENLKRK